MALLLVCAMLPLQAAGSAEEGAAETSGLTVAQLQAVNAVERIGGLPKCSAAFCWGEYTDGPLVIGRNYDYSDAFALLKDDVAVTV